MIAIIQILLSLGIIALILLQQRSGSTGGLFGGDGGGGVYQTRRGTEKIIFYATIVLCVVFVALALYQLVKS